MNTYNDDDNEKSPGQEESNSHSSSENKPNEEEKIEDYEVKGETTNVSTFENEKSDENKENINIKQEKAVNEMNTHQNRIKEFKMDDNKENIPPNLIDKAPILENTDKKLEIATQSKLESNDPIEENKVNVIQEKEIENLNLLKNSVKNIASSPKSKNSDYNDLFSYSQQSNARRIQSQIAELQSKAEEYVKSLIKFSQMFDKMKIQLKSCSNKLFNSIFSFFGYKYKSTVLQPNIFFLIAQSWLVNLGRLLDKSIKTDELSKTNFSDIISLIKSKEENQLVNSEDENIFLKDLDILTGNIMLEKIKSSSYTLIQNNVAKNFLLSFSFVVVNEFQPQALEINKDEFEDCILGLIKKSIEKTLNAEMQTDIYTFIDFALIADFLKNKDKNYTFETYLSNIIENYSGKLKRNLNTFESNEIKICARAFYEFSKFNIRDLLQELKLFIDNYSSIFSKFKSILSKSYQGCKVFTKNALDIYNNFFTKNIFKDLNIRTKLNNTYSEAQHGLLRSLAKTVKFGDSRIRKIKLWLDDSFDYLKKLQLIERSYDLIIKSIKLPFRMSNKILVFTIDQAHLGYEKFTLVKKKIIDLLDKFFINIFNNLSEKYQIIKNLIKFQDLGEHVKIFVNKKIFSLIHLPNVKGMLEALFGIIKVYYTWINKTAEQLKILCWTNLDYFKDFPKKLKPEKEAQ